MVSIDQSRNLRGIGIAHLGRVPRVQDRHVRSRSYITSLDWKSAAKRIAYRHGITMAGLHGCPVPAEGRTREGETWPLQGEAAWRRGGLKRGHKKLLLLVYEFVIIGEVEVVRSVPAPHTPACPGTPSARVLPPTWGSLTLTTLRAAQFLGWSVSSCGQIGIDAVPVALVSSGASNSLCES
jgi:hypothetical protein